MSAQNFFQYMSSKQNSSENIDLENMRIRPVRVEDAYLITELRTLTGVFENIPCAQTERVNFNQNFINNLSFESDHMLVAELPSNNSFIIAGVANLHVNKNPRQRHCATIGVLVHPGYQRRGIGRMLMEKLIDIADNWISVKRIELEVIEDNTPAINLYKKLGFIQEGIKKHYVMKNGEYKSAIMMAKYKMQ